MARRFFTFPNPVNPTAARLVAAGVVALDALALGTGWLWLSLVLAYGFLARVAAGPRLSPLGRGAVALARRLDPDAVGVPGPPKRFAQSIGAAFTLASSGCFLAGAHLATVVLLAILLAPATLEAALGYCVGCEVFALLISTGVIPETVCEACGDLWSARAIERRLARGAVTRH